jgi:hypothetical protein
MANTIHSSEAGQCLGNNPTQALSHENCSCLFIVANLFKSLKFYTPRPFTADDSH